MLADGACVIGGAWIKDGAGAGAGAALIQDGEGSIDAALIEGEEVRRPHQRWRMDN